MRRLPVTLPVACSSLLCREYAGTVYVPAAPGALTIYGTGENPADVKISEAIDSEMDRNSWRHLVNPGGKYMPQARVVYVRQLPEQIRRHRRRDVFRGLLVAE